MSVLAGSSTSGDSELDRLLELGWQDSPAANDGSPQAAAHFLPSSSRSLSQQRSCGEYRGLQLCSRTAAGSASPVPFDTSDDESDWEGENECSTNGSLGRLVNTSRQCSAVETGGHAASAYAVGLYPVQLKCNNYISAVLPSLTTAYEKEECVCIDKMHLCTATVHNLAGDSRIYQSDTYPILSSQLLYRIAACTCHALSAMMVHAVQCCMYRCLFAWPQQLTDLDIIWLNMHMCRLLC